MDFKPFNEAELETAIIELFTEQGYSYVHGEEIHRDFEEILLKDDLTAYLQKRFPDLTETEKQKIVARLDNIPATPLFQGNRESFILINEGFDLPRDNPKSLSLHIDYIDYENPENNIFKVVNQYSVQGDRLRRSDLLMFINGIPVAIFEFKSAIKEDTTIADAHKQITIRYCRDIPKLMKYAFLSVISDGANTRLGSIFTDYEHYRSWNKINDKEKTSNGISALVTMIKGAFAKERVLAILRDFVYYPDDKETAIVTRYPQFFAANKMFENIKAHKKPEGDGKGGTYFGATGCGKTYTMLFLSRLLGLRAKEELKNPTIVIITDREDLDRQTSELFVASTRYLKDKNVESIGSRTDLQDKLGINSGGLADYYNGAESGGVYLTTIQKFCEATGLLSDRNNIICISDEAH
jgi:type I restriction enzyme R subunit